jgi:hypothetical protein
MELENFLEREMEHFDKVLIILEKASRKYGVRERFADMIDE